MNTLKSALEGVEKERDYYFSKLREVELLCQDQGEENAPFVDRLMEVLYSTDEQVSLRPLIDLNRIQETFIFTDSYKILQRRIPGKCFLVVKSREC